MTAMFDIKNERHVRDLTSAAVKAAMCEALFCTTQLKEIQDVRIKPGFETACWSYLPPHRIYVGTGIVARGKPGLTRSQLEEYVKSHYRHERGHALFTERNSRVIRQELAAIKAPFQLWNLFEDARMEDAYRGIDVPFNWLEFEDLPYSLKPESMLFAFIQAEGDDAVVRSFYASVDIEAQRKLQLGQLTESLAALAAKGDRAKQARLQALLGMMGMGPAVSPEMEREQALALLEKVWSYYQRICAQADTLGVIPILKEWLDEFGRTDSAPSRGDEKGESEGGDLFMGYALADDKGAREEFDKDTVEVLVPGGKAKVEPDRDDKAIGQKGRVLGLTSHPLDLARIENVARKFGKFFEAEVHAVRTSSPQKRISARHYSVGRPYFKVKQLQGRARKKLFMVFDCSASMGGHHVAEGRVLLAALSRLARRGFIEGHVALSAGSPARWELFKLPMADETIARVYAFAGAEGLEACLKDHLALAREADYTLVYTDAQICDAPINKANLHRHGVFTWGLYAGDNDNDELDSMRLYFDKAILRDNADQLVDAMLLQKK